LLGVGCLGSSYVALRDPASSPVIPGWSSDWEEITAAAWQCCAWMRCGLLSRRRFRSVISASPTFPCCSVQPLLAMRSRPAGEITFDSIDMGLFETRVLVRTSKSAHALHRNSGSYKINICLDEECRHDSSFALIQMSRITPRLNLPFNIKIFIFHVYSFVFQFFCCTIYALLVILI
jgi:hypothetical protein